jgi:metallo-beta-lactamase class B
MQVGGRKTWIAGLLVAIAGLYWCFAGGRRERIPGLPMVDGSTVTIMPGVHMLGGIGPSAAYAIETKQGLVLIDSGLETDALPLRTALDELHVDLKKLRAIFLTHVHGDHCGGAGYLRQATGAKIHAGEQDAPLIRAGTPKSAFFSTFYMPNHEPHPTEVDVELVGGEKFEFGDVRIEAVAAPGHTPGSTCYLVERDGMRVLFSGDVIMNYTGRPLGTYSTYLAPRYRGNPTDYLATLKTLRALPVPDVILPGHPNANNGPRSPRVTALEWNAMLGSGIAEMERLLARQAADGANFLDGEPCRLLPDLYYLGDFHETAIYGFFSAEKFFIVNAPGGAGLSEFIKAALKKLDLPATKPAAVFLTDCSEDAAAGLPDLVENFAAQVVAPLEGISRLRGICPPETQFWPINGLPHEYSLNVTTIPLDGRGVAPAAYRFRFSGKVVLFTGQIPVEVDQETVQKLFQDFQQPLGSPQAYVNSLRRLAEPPPDLWLPACPHHGQAANCYDNFWPQLLEQNYRSMSQYLQRR